MRRYDIVSGILIILSIIDFALAAPVLVQEKRQASPKDVITVLGKRGDEGLLELGEEYFKTWEKPVASSSTHSSSSSAASGPDPGSTNAVQPPAPNAASPTANPDPLTDPSSCSSEHGLQARGGCFGKLADNLLDFANWLDEPGYGSHEVKVTDEYGVHVPLLDLGPPKLVPYDQWMVRKGRVQKSTYPRPQSYPDYPKLSSSEDSDSDYSMLSSSTVSEDPDYSRPSNLADPNFDLHHWINLANSGRPPSSEPHIPVQTEVGETSGHAESGPSPPEPQPGPEPTDPESQSLGTDSQLEDPEAAALYAEKGKAKVPDTVRDVGNLA